MKTDIINKIRPIVDGIQFGNRVSLFFALLAVYYILNLFTSDINSGMSGGLEAEHNVVNQLMASLLVVFVLYHDINTPTRWSYTLIAVVFTFFIYLCLRNYFGFINIAGNRGLTYFTGLSKHAYWAGSLIFCLKCFRFSKPEDLKRLIQMIIWVYLVFATYRLFTQKAIVSGLGISAGINSVGQTYMLAPLVLMVFKGKWKIILLLYMTFICVYSAKRQAAAGMAIVIFFSMSHLYKAYFKNNKFIAYLLLAVTLYFGSGYIYRAFEDLVSRQEKVEMNDNMDSGRSDLWKAALDGFERSDNTSKWFGGGSGTGRKYIGEYFPVARAPHNGFVEILCDYGYVGIILYLGFFIVLFGYTLKYDNNDYKLIHLSICSAWAFHNMVSHPGNMRLIFLAIGIGYLSYIHNLGIRNEGNTVNQ